MGYYLPEIDIEGCNQWVYRFWFPGFRLAVSDYGPEFPTFHAYNYNGWSRMRQEEIDQLGFFEKRIITGLLQLPDAIDIFLYSDHIEVCLNISPDQMLFPEEIEEESCLSALDESLLVTLASPLPDRWRETWPIALYHLLMAFRTVIEPEEIEEPETLSALDEDQEAILERGMAIYMDNLNMEECRC
jgi:hypothetical protein